MANFKADIIDAVIDGKETESDIQGVLIKSQLGYYDKYRDRRNAGIVRGKLYLWDEIKNKLDYEYYAGFGSMDCHDIELWTPKYVYYIHEYDGSTSVVSVNRNPIAIESGDMQS